MTQGEFNEFLEYHATSFPSFRSWLRKQPNGDAIRAAWFRLMPPSLTTTLLQEASDKAFKENRTIFPSNTAQSCFRLALEIQDDVHRRHEYAAQIKDGSVACKICNDVGRATVLKFGRMAELAKRLYGEGEFAKQAHRASQGLSVASWAVCSVQCECQGANLERMSRIRRHESKGDPTPELWQNLRDTVRRVGVTDTVTGRVTPGAATVREAREIFKRHLEGARTVYDSDKTHDAEFIHDPEPFDPHALTDEEKAAIPF